MIESETWESKDGRKRYALWKTWDQTLQPMAFILLRPGSEGPDRNTYRTNQLIEWSKIQGCGGIDIRYLFPTKTTGQKGVHPPPKGNGKEDIEAIKDQIAFGNAKTVMAGWGGYGWYHNQDQKVHRLYIKAGIALRCAGVKGRRGYPLLPERVSPREDLFVYFGRRPGS